MTRTKRPVRIPTIGRCPYCGAAERVDGNHSPRLSGYVDKALGNHYVHCGNCWASGPTEETELAAVTQWNLISEWVESARKSLQRPRGGR